MGPKTNFTDELGTANYNLKTLSFEKVNIQNSSITTKTKDYFWNDSERQEAHNKIREILDMEGRSKNYARKTQNLQESWREILNRDKQKVEGFSRRKQEVMFFLILFAILSKWELSFEKLKFEKKLKNRKNRKKTQKNRKKNAFFKKKFIVQKVPANPLSHQIFQFFRKNARHKQKSPGLLCKNRDR